MVRGEERMEHPRPGEGETGMVSLGISSLIKWIAIVCFYSGNANRGRVGGVESV